MFPSTCAYDPWGLFPWLGREREILSLGCRFVDASPRQCGLLQYYSLTWTCFPSSGDLSALSALHMLSVPLNCSSQGFFSFFFHLWSQLPTLSSLVHCILLKLDWNHLTPCPPLANNALQKVTARLGRLLAIFSWFLKTVSQLIWRTV